MMKMIRDWDAWNDKSYDDSVKLKRTEIDPFRLGYGLG